MGSRTGNTLISLAATIVRSTMIRGPRAGTFSIAITAHVEHSCVRLCMRWVGCKSWVSFQNVEAIVASNAEKMEPSQWSIFPVYSIIYTE